MYDAKVVEQTAPQVEPSHPAQEPATGGVPAMERQTPDVQPVTVEPQPHETPGQRTPLDERSSQRGGGLALRWTLAGFKRLATLAIALVAIVMALVTWDYYVTAPWTRDGRLRVQVASIAPQVSGQITELRVGDNQYVRATCST